MGYRTCYPPRKKPWLVHLIDLCSPLAGISDFIFDITFLYFILVKEEKRSGNQVMIRKKDWPSPAFNVLLKLVIRRDVCLCNLVTQLLKLSDTNGMEHELFKLRIALKTQIYFKVKCPSFFLIYLSVLLQEWL